LHCKWEYMALQRQCLLGSRQEVAVSVPELHMEHDLVARHALAHCTWSGLSDLPKALLACKPVRVAGRKAMLVSEELTDAGGCTLSARLLGPLATTPNPSCDVKKACRPLCCRALSVGGRCRVAPQGEGRQVDVATVDLPCWGLCEGPTIRKQDFKALRKQALTKSL